MGSRLPIPPSTKPLVGVRLRWRQVLFDLASDVGAAQADRTLAAWGRSRPAPRPRDVSYQRGYPSPRGRADRPLDKGHMVAHAAGDTFGPNMFPQDWDLNRGWSTQGRR